MSPGVTPDWLIDGSCFAVLQVSLMSIHNQEVLLPKKSFSVWVTARCTAKAVVSTWLLKFYLFSTSLPLEWSDGSQCFFSLLTENCEEQVEGCWNFIWSCVVVFRLITSYTKTKKSTDTIFELFWMKEHDIQIEALELKNKNDKIVVFAWELKGHRSTIRGKQANYAFYWSPICLLLCPGRTKKHMRGSSTYTMLMSWRQWPQQSISWLQRWTGTAFLSSPSKLGAVITKLIWTLYFSFLM